MKKKKWLAVCAAAVLCTSMVPVTASAETEELLLTAASDTVPYCSQEEWQVLRLTNQYRLGNGKTPYTTFSSLQQAAKTRAQELTVHFAADHSRPDGSSCFTVLDDYKISFSILAGENIAAGYYNVASVVNGWWNSPCHRSNMLHDDFSHMGVGLATNSGTKYWSEDFIGKCDYRSLKVLTPAEGISVSAGTSIEDMGLVAEAVCRHGVSYLPVPQELCENYHPSGAGKVQEVTLRFGGQSAVFKVNVLKALDTKPLKVSKAEAAPRRVTLNWKAVSGADGYAIYRKTAGETNYTRIRNTVKISYADQKVIPGKIYYYKVRAYQKVDGRYLYAEPGVTAKVSTKPGKAEFTKFISGKNYVKAQWAQVPEADGYEIWYREGNSSYKKARNLMSGDILSAGHYQRKAGTKYTYRIRAFCLADGKRVYGAYSPEYTVTTKK